MTDVTDLCPGCFSEQRTESSCTRCGYHHEPHRIPIALPVHTVVRGQYVVGRVLGRPGALGITYLAWDVSLDVPVAIKEFFPRALALRTYDCFGLLPVTEHDTAFREGLARFVDEARTLARFDHPNIIRVRDVFEDHGTAFMVMEYHEGRTLDDYVRECGGRLEVSSAIKVISSVLNGLKAVHAAGLLHRDIKPRNIYITTADNVLLLDFGSARSVSYFDGQTRSIVISPEYSVPEQWSDTGRQGPCTDVFATGATLFFMRTGSPLPPLEKRLASPAQTVLPSDFAGIPQGLREVIAIAIDNQPYRRYQTVEEFEAALKNAVNGDGGSVTALHRHQGEMAASLQGVPVNSSAMTPGQRQNNNRSTVVMALVVHIGIALGMYALNLNDSATKTDTPMPGSTAETPHIFSSEAAAPQPNRDTQEQPDIQPDASPETGSLGRGSDVPRSRGEETSRSRSRSDDGPRGGARRTYRAGSGEDAQGGVRAARLAVGKTWLMDQIRDRDGTFPYNTHEEAQEGIWKNINLSPSFAMQNIRNGEISWGPSVLFGL